MVQSPDPYMRAYFHALVDTPGVAAGNNFLSVFNPVGSSKTVIALNLFVSCFATSSATSPNSLNAYRISAASGGTLIAASTVNRFITADSDPVCIVRTGNPTVTTVGLVLIGISPVISVGSGQSSSTASPPPGASFVMIPGEGIAISTPAGDSDQIWNISLVWGERP
jgi:hypothetical protein